MREQGLFERVVEAMLAMEGLGEEVWFRDIALLAKDHVDGPSGVQDQDLGFIG